MFMETFAKLGIAGVFTGFSWQHNDIYPAERLLTAKRFSNNAFDAISIKSTFELFFCDCHPESWHCGVVIAEQQCPVLICTSVIFIKHPLILCRRQQSGVTAKAVRFYAFGRSAFFEFRRFFSHQLDLRRTTSARPRCPSL